MTTEDDFQAALDRDPTDWQTRLVLADWLDERGDPRAAGYRALGRGRYTPMHSTDGGDFSWFDAAEYVDGGFGCPESDLPSDWFIFIVGGRRFPAPPDKRRPWTKSFNGRREAEDAAVRAFAKLSANRRAELLGLSVAQ